MKFSLAEQSLCWCGHGLSSHPNYIEYTGYVCTKCDNCLDFVKTVNEK